MFYFIFNYVFSIILVEKGTMKWVYHSNTDLVLSDEKYSVFTLENTENKRVKKLKKGITYLTETYDDTEMIPDKWYYKNERSQLKLLMSSQNTVNIRNQRSKCLIRAGNKLVFERCNKAFGADFYVCEDPLCLNIDIDKRDKLFRRMYYDDYYKNKVLDNVLKIYENNAFYGNNLGYTNPFFNMYNNFPYSNNSCSSESSSSSDSSSSSSSDC